MCCCLTIICSYLATTSICHSGLKRKQQPEPEETSLSVPIIACLTVHIAGQGRKKKPTKKDTKQRSSLTVIKSNLGLWPNRNK